MTTSLLILGGTKEAVSLAELAAADPRLRVVSSLAGRTKHPSPVPGEVRVGGFGGVEGLASFLVKERIDLVVDATHPYASAISEHALKACERAQVDRLQLWRPPWEPVAGDRWLEAISIEGAARDIPKGSRRVFLSTGRKELSAFAGRTDLWFLVRLIDEPEAPLPLAHYELILDRGPYSEPNERALLLDNRIDVLVTKNSGGAPTYAKLAAARELELPVVMIARPDRVPGPIAGSATKAYDWVVERL